MALEAHDVEATAEDVAPDPMLEPEPFRTAELVPAQSTGVMMPFDAAEVSDAMTAYQEVVRATLQPSDWQGTPGQKGAFVKKSGWRKMAKAFGLSVTRVDDGIERDEDGSPVRAWAIYRAAHANGQQQDGDGYCSVDESRFVPAKGRLKLENDLRATATTRAKNRAISDLVGMGEVSAEEIAVMASTSEPFAGDLKPVLDALTATIGAETARKVMDWIAADNGGTVPAPVGRALVAVGRAITAAAPAEDTDVPF